MGFIKVKLQLLVVTLFLNYEEGYVFQCPHRAQWHLRAKEICNVSEKYFCLFDDNYKRFTEFCKDSYDFEKSGYKLIVVGSLQREICHTNRYQPIQFWSNGSSECIYSKSPCNEKGHLIFNNGTNEVDRACMCDYTNGYDFVNAPKHMCFSIPSEEDCSCYLKQCDNEEILTPDYRCVNTSEWKPPFSCSIKTFFQSSGNNSPDQKKVLTVATTNNFLLGLHNYRLDCVFVLYAVIPVFIAIGILALVLEEHLVKEVAIKDMRTSIDIRKTQKFLPTKASEQIFKDVEMYHCILITGPPGCGKTAIAYHMAFKLEQSKGYRVVTVAMPGDVFKLKSSFYKTKQVLIIDDVIGKNTICNFDVQTLLDAIKTALQKNSCIKIIMTCRSHIYLMNDFQDAMIHHCDMLLSNMQLSIQERRVMLQLYLGDFKTNIKDNVLMLYNFFPSLCALAVNEKENLSDFLTYPVSFLNQEISTSKTNCDVLYLALAITVVKNNNVEKSFFDMSNVDAEDMLHDIYLESRLLQFPVKSLLYLTLKSLNNTFILETATSFSLLNDQLFNTICLVLGSSFIGSILKYGNVTFINHRMQFGSLKEKSDQFTILIPSHLEDVYFIRKLQDIENGIIRDSLCMSRQMQFPVYRKMLSIYLEKHIRATKRTLTDKSDGSSVLHVLACLGYHDILSNVMRNYPLDVNSIDNENRTVLHLACSQPNYEVVELILSAKAKVNSQDCNGRTALHTACKHGFSNITTILIANGADINKRDKQGRMPIHLAISEGHDSLVQLLIEQNADIKCEDKTGKSPLIIACEKHNYVIIKILLDKIHVLSQHYLTTFEKACRQGNEDAIEELVKHNQNKDVTFSDGSTPLHVACEKNSLSILKILLESNFDINVKNKAGFTPLFQSCFQCRLEIVKFLLKHLADTNCTDRMQKTPLHVACMKGFNEIALVLIKSHADVNARDKTGQTPLFSACSNGDLHLIKCLLENGADVNIQDNNSMLASNVALKKGFSKVFEMLNEWKI